MTCKDCIHFGVCWKQQELLDEREFGEEQECCEEASRFIVLPCKEGDTVWFLNIYPSIYMKQNAVYEAKVVRVYIEKGTVLTLAVQVKTEWGTPEFPYITDIGKTVFLSREDAEKALKERSEGK